MNKLFSSLDQHFFTEGIVNVWKSLHICQWTVTFRFTNFPPKTSVSYIIILVFSSLMHWLVDHDQIGQVVSISCISIIELKYYNWNQLV